MVTNHEFVQGGHPTARWILSALLLAACSSTEAAKPDTPDVPMPADSPGVSLNVSESACPDYDYSYPLCMAWSSDSRTLFAVLRRSTDTVLVGMDIPPAYPPPVAGGYRLIGPIGRAEILVTTQDPRTIFFVRNDPKEPEFSYVMRMSLADGTTTKVASGSGSNISLSRDGSVLAYHKYSTSIVDTIVLMDVASGMERARTVSPSYASLRGISPDGRDVALAFNNSAVIWHSATNVREPVKDGGLASGTGTRHVVDVRWGSRGFSTLYKVDSGELTEVSDSTGAVINYAPHTGSSGTIAWSPAVSRVFTAEAIGGCYPHPDDCTSAYSHSEFVVISLSDVRTIGSVNSSFRGGQFPQFFPSPDGRWLAYYVPSWAAHYVYGGRLYLLPTGF